MARLSVTAGQQICEALGLKGRLVTSVELRFTANGVATATIEELVPEDNVSELATAVRRFELVERLEEVDGHGRNQTA